MFHPPSLLFPDGHLPDFDVHDYLAGAYLSWKRRTCALPHERRGVWLPGRFRALHRLSPSSPTRPLLWTVARRPSAIRTTIASLTSWKPHARTLDCSVFPQCFKPLFRTFLMVILLFREKSKKACLGKPLRGREKERKEKVLWSVLQSRCQGKVSGTALGFILLRLTEIFILMNEISEKTWNEELNKLFLVKIQFRENYTRLSTTRRSKIWSEEMQNMH